MESVFDKLSEEDQRFLEQYLLAGFSIKTLERNSPMGYAAIRSRLDRLIANYESVKDMESQKRAVFSAVALRSHKRDQPAFLSVPWKGADFQRVNSPGTDRGAPPGPSRFARR